MASSPPTMRRTAAESPPSITATARRLARFADGSHQPTPIVENRADSNGGAVYVSGNVRATLYAPHIVDNTAEDGAVVYYDPAASNDGNIAFNGGDSYDPDKVSSLGGTTYCVPVDTQCNVIAGNSTRHTDDTPSSDRS